MMLSQIVSRNQKSIISQLKQMTNNGRNIQINGIRRFASS